MENFNNSYSEFILHIKKIVTDITFFNKILNETENEKIIRVKNFNDSLNTTTLFNHFLKKKIKLFSHKEKDTLKVSESFFGSELSLKKIFNNQDDISFLKNHDKKSKRFRHCDYLQIEVQVEVEV